MRFFYVITPLIISLMIVSVYFDVVRSDELTDVNSMLISDKYKYVDYGFSSDVVYVENGSSVFNKPIVIDRKSIKDIKIDDISFSWSNKSRNLDLFLENYEIKKEILGVNKDYYLINFNAVSRFNRWCVFNVKMDINIKGNLLKHSWWNSSFQYHMRVDIDADKVPSDFNYFPVYVEHTSNSFKENVTGSNEFRFVSWDNSSMFPHEIEYYNTATGSLYAWVNVTDVNSSPKSDTYFFIYYDNDAATDENSTNVWDSDYKGVWHLDETGGMFYDSTAYYHHGNLSDGDADTDMGQSGKIGLCVDLNGDGDYIDFGIIPDFDPDASDFTVDVFFKHEEGTGYDAIMGKRDSGNSNEGWMVARYPDTDRIYVELDYGSGSDTCQAQPYDYDFWHFATYRRDYNTRESVYVNGTEDPDTIDTTSHDVDKGTEFLIGDTLVNNPFDGKITEARITKGLARSSDWINFTYMNMEWDVLTFYDVVVVPAAVNYDPNITSEFPTNNTNGVNITQNFSCYVYDDDGDYITYTIECSNGYSSSGTVLNSTIWCNFTNINHHGYNYTVWVNITDDNSTYQRDFFEFRTTIDTASFDLFTVVVMVILAMLIFMYLSKKS